MQTNVFRRLQQQLDQYSIGFPATDSGIELDVLQAMFTDEEAALFTALTAELETPAAVAKRLNRPAHEVAAQLEAMAKKGLLFRRREGESVQYSAIPFIHGLLEFQIDRLDKKTVKLVGQYINEKLKYNMAEFTGSFQRTIPVQQSVEVEHHVAPYDDACDILRSQELIAVTDCACRRQLALFDKGCGKPMDVCFMFGPMGEYYVENGMGRQVEVDEAIEILTKAQDAGLITQPATAHKPFTMCSCCGDCCGFLHAINKQPNPAELVSSNYTLAFDEEHCSSCAICVERCEMHANEVNDDGVLECNSQRCIGCGLCVTTCPEQARVLAPKPGDEHVNPPLSTGGQMASVAEKRGLEGDDPATVVTFGFPK